MATTPTSNMFSLSDVPDISGMQDKYNSAEQDLLSRDSPSNTALRIRNAILAMQAPDSAELDRATLANQTALGSLRQDQTASLTPDQLAVMSPAQQRAAIAGKQSGLEASLALYGQKRTEMNNNANTSFSMAQGMEQDIQNNLLQRVNFLANDLSQANAKKDEITQMLFGLANTGVSLTPELNKTLDSALTKGQKAIWLSQDSAANTSKGGVESWSTTPTLGADGKYYVLSNKGNSKPADALNSPDTTTTTPTVQTNSAGQTLDQYIASKEKDLQMSASPQRRDQWTKEFNDQSGTAAYTIPPNTVVGAIGKDTIDNTIAGYSTKAIPLAGGLTQAAIDQAATQYALTGNMPSIGLGSTGAGGQKRTAIQNRAAELGSGTNIAVNKAQLTSMGASLTQQTDYLNSTQRALTNADAGLQSLVGTYGGKVNNDVPLANMIKNPVKYNLGNDDVAAFKAGLAEIANEYTQVFSRGGQISDVNKKKAADILNGNMSMSMLKSVTGELQTQGKIVIKGTQGQVNSITDQMNNILTGKSLTDTSSSNSSSSSSSNVWQSPGGKSYNLPYSSQ